MKTKTLLWCSVLLCLSLFTTCSDDEEDENRAGTFYGPQIGVGQGNAKTWVTTDEAGVPTSIGVTFSEGAINAAGLGTTMRMYMLSLPPQAEQTLYDHVMLDWNPQGHEPPGLYNVPHFDLHFYMIPEAEVAAIQGSLELDDTPNSQFIPQNYILTPGIVPGMGAHWVDATDMNNAPGNFAKNFIYGSFEGEYIFHEPMFTLAYLSTLPAKGTETMSIPQPPSYQKPGLYPQKYSYSYNSTTKEYTISLLELTSKP
ncbi:hypothetical protein EFB08_07140 [Rufibacter latericius]|uniref:TTHB210-like domain-containing protein n=2 Tax=Rufibacter latericius TaxID=2487040 RepID=A0A3M9MUJ8_9BACT|nr:hypothetical protein EFB08_07140 [Rufibacter latericius]